MSDSKVDFRLQFLFLSGKTDPILYKAPGNEYIPLDQDIFLAASAVIRIDSFKELGFYHIYTADGCLYRVKTYTAKYL